MSWENPFLSNVFVPSIFTRLNIVYKFYYTFILRKINIKFQIGILNIQKKFPKQLSIAARGIQG
jgi:hypothetical protein